MSEQMAYPYDVFISCNVADRDWAESWLSPRLREAGLNVWTRHTFTYDVPELVNIESAIATSRHTLLALTPVWVESEWEGVYQYS